MFSLFVNLILSCKSYYLECCFLIITINNPENLVFHTGMYSPLFNLACNYFMYILFTVYNQMGKDSEYA